MLPCRRIAGQNVATSGSRPGGECGRVGEATGRAAVPPHCPAERRRVRESTCCVVEVVERNVAALGEGFAEARSSPRKGIGEASKRIGGSSVITVRFYICWVV